MVVSSLMGDGNKMGGNNSMAAPSYLRYYHN